MCRKCYDKIELLPPKPIKSKINAKVFSAAVYGKDIQKMIRGVKYHNRKELAYYQAKLMFEFWKNVGEKDEKYLIVSVPLYKTRQKKRGYNHMFLVAEEFAKLTGYDINKNLIKRVKDTKPQYRLTVKERSENLKDAFEVYKEHYNNENILIIDDILTTGSTVNEIIKKLNESGITKVTCFTTSCTESHIF
jgi:ComF family protein